MRGVSIRSPREGVGVGAGASVGGLSILEVCPRLGKKVKKKDLLWAHCQRQGSRFTPAKDEKRQIGDVSSYSSSWAKLVANMKSRLPSHFHIWVRLAQRERERDSWLGGLLWLLSIRRIRQLLLPSPAFLRFYSYFVLRAVFHLWQPRVMQLYWGRFYVATFSLS